jgi:hypothetical protein
LCPDETKKGVRNLFSDGKRFLTFLTPIRFSTRIADEMFRVRTMTKNEDHNEAEYRSNVKKLAVAKLINHVVLVAFGSLMWFFIVVGLYAASPASIPSPNSKRTFIDNANLLLIISIIPSLIYWALMYPVFKNIVRLIQAIKDEPHDASS